MFISGTNPVYTLTYDYSGNTAVKDENAIQLALRANNADTWADLSGTINTSANTIVQTGLTGTEYILGGTGSVPLPITLLSFTAEVVDDRVLLHWRTATELNNDFFLLEHSMDGVLFQELTRINGGGTSEEPKAYQHFHKSPTEGINYYRLTQFDFDGKSEIFKTVYVELGPFEHISIYPNPASLTLNVSMSRRTDQKISFELSDLSGRKFELPLHHIQGGNHVFNLTNVPTGVYILAIRTEGRVSNYKIAVSHHRNP